MEPVIKLRVPDGSSQWEIPILHEDDHLLAVLKPARLLTSPDRYDQLRPNLMRLLHHEIARGAAWVRQRQIEYLANVHRLDFETSGVLLLAKNKPALIAVANQFGAQSVTKIYIALVHGKPSTLSFRIEAKIGPHPVKTGLMRVDEKNGKSALTEIKLREPFSGYSLLECRPLTGRTHQIRVHLQKAGFPIVGDALYGGRNLLLSHLKPGYRLKANRVEKPLLERVALHAEQLTVSHPLEERKITITAPWSKDLRVAKKYLAQFASA